MPALTLRPAPLDRVAALRALPAVLIAAAGGAWLALAVGAAFGVDLGSGASVWIGVAGACACVSGVMVGAGGNAPAAAVLAVAAIAAVVLAAQTGAHPAPGGGLIARAVTAPPSSPTRPDLRPQTQPQRAPTISAGARAGRFVRSYYAAIDGGDFAAAWARLSPAVQGQFGGFEVWRQGYGTTLAQRVEAVQRDGAQIRHVLVARDRTPCGTAVEQRFLVTWTVRGGTATSLHAVKVAGQDPAAAC